MPRLLRSAPYLPVADVVESAAYYRDVFGFATEYIGGDPPLFAMCTRDGFAVMLRRVEDSERIRPVELQGGAWDAYFWVDDVGALHAELVSRGAMILYGPVLQVYNMLEFAVRDADGHVLGFGQATA
jgi:catechol 2,3-dioxygenase-like lactoylglutathione lyase family enzyme